MSICPDKKVWPAISEEEFKPFHDHCKEFVIFYTMIGCHWCTLARPFFLKAMEQLGNECIPVHEMIYQHNQKHCQSKEIDGYPCIIKYTPGAPIEKMEKDRTLENILAFLRPTP